MHPENSASADGFHPQDRVVLAAMGTVLAGAMAYGFIHGTWPTALLIGGLLLGAAAAAAWLGRGLLLSQTALPFLGIALVGLMIHVARGHNESHFAVFAFLACMVTYRRPLPILVAAGTVAVHHLTFNQLQAWALGPICFTEPSIARVLEHAVYVVAETVVLLLLAAQARASFATAEELTRIVESLQSTDGSIDLGAATLRPKDPTVAQLVGSLQHIARSIEQARTAAESVRVAATEIASGNLSLSTRTEQAGASIQQTASAVEQMAAAIRNGSDNAVQANQLADAASCAAAAGGQAVGGMTTTMNEIQQSSRKITDIIGVIDAIAFQTNILALNAAVEAARAGEQGRGFSVVAAEVRTLARRCAEAAREVKQLITSSVAHVDAGSSLVGTTGKTIAEVVEQVRRVHGLIGQIATGSVEQNDGIGQINQAINRLDRDTQQNAALVEQTSAAADSLRQQADELARAMQVFKVPAALAG